MYRNIPFSEKATSFDHFPVLQNNNAPLMFRLIPVEQYDLARMSDTSLALDVIIQEIPPPEPDKQRNFEHIFEKAHLLAFSWNTNYR